MGMANSNYEREMMAKAKAKAKAKRVVKAKGKAKGKTTKGAMKGKVRSAKVEKAIRAARAKVKAAKAKGVRPTAAAAKTAKTAKVGTGTAHGSKDSKRGYSTSFATPAKGKRIKLEIDRVPAPLNKAFRAKLKAEGVSMRATTLALWEQWTAGTVKVKAKALAAAPTKALGPAKTKAPAKARKATKPKPSVPVSLRPVNAVDDGD